MSSIILVENLFKRLAEAGVVDVPQKHYPASIDGDDYKVIFNSCQGTAAIFMMVTNVDSPDAPDWINLASFYPSGCWSGPPLDEKWTGKYVRILEAAEAIILKEFQDGKHDQ